jgi:hypothetical protein
MEFQTELRGTLLQQLRVGIGDQLVRAATLYQVDKDVSANARGLSRR